LIRSDEKLSPELEPIVNSWNQLQKQMVTLLAPARVIIALFVDDHSNSRGLSQRLLQNLTGSLNEKIQQWMNQNTIGQSLLLLGDFLYRHGSSINKMGNANEVLWQPFSQLKERSLDMPVQQFQDLQSIQTLAYFYKRFNHESYELINNLIRQHLVVMGMSDAMAICVIKDDDSRAKLASWTRRITVEQRRLQECREQLKNNMLA
jgi:hypothetical protein